MGLNREFPIVSNTLPEELSKELSIGSSGDVLKVAKYEDFSFFNSGYPLIFHILQQTHADKVRRVMEIGTRSRGIYFLNALSKRFQGYRLLGCDMSCTPDMIADAARFRVPLMESCWRYISRDIERVDVFYHHHLDPQDPAYEPERFEVTDRLLDQGGLYIGVKGWGEGRIYDALFETSFHKNGYIGGILSVETRPIEGLRLPPSENGYDVMIMKKPD